jgi:DNA-directed RNA polymerase subunit E'/Rpb7
VCCVKNRDEKQEFQIQESVRIRIIKNQNYRNSGERS